MFDGYLLHLSFLLLFHGHQAETVKNVRMDRLDTLNASYVPYQLHVVYYYCFLISKDAVMVVVS